MRWLILLGITFTTLGGCSLEDALENAPCETAEDCLGSQTCVRTQHQLANESVGLCRSNGECAAGEQEGCVATGTGCSFSSSLTAVMASSGATYCCPNSFSGEGTIVVEATDQSSAWCITVDQIVMCDDDSDCVSGVACVRTLEQEAEPDEMDVGEREVEPGWCLPDGCLGGSQEGCRTEESCGSGFSSPQTAEGRVYCCETPIASGFTAHVYDETELGESAACTQCDTTACPSSAACTLLEDPTCVVSSGVCGCTP
jgi:hypothetical protein